MAKKSASGAAKTAMSELCNVNRPIRPAAANPSPLNQITTLSDAGSDIKSDSGSHIILDVDFEERMEADLLSALLGTKAEEEQQCKQAKKRVSKSNAAKQADLPDEIFDYILTAKCQRFFLLAWYDDITYASSTASNTADGSPSKALPIPCCNGSSCSSPLPKYSLPLPKYLQSRKPFVEPITTTYTEANRKWAIYQTLELKKWKKDASIRFWKGNNLGSEVKMSDSLIMPDDCLFALAKNAPNLADLQKLEKFLEP